MSHVLFVDDSPGTANFYALARPHLTPERRVFPDDLSPARPRLGAKCAVQIRMRVVPSTPPMTARTLVVKPRGSAWYRLGARADFGRGVCKDSCGKLCTDEDCRWRWRELAKELPTGPFAAGFGNALLQAKDCQESRDGLAAD